MKTYYFNKDHTEIDLNTISNKENEWERDTKARKLAHKTILAKDDAEAQFILNNPEHNDVVQVRCYNSTEYMFRPSALEFYKTAMIHSEGSERERYTTIYTRLGLGQREVSDNKKP